MKIKTGKEKLDEIMAAMRLERLVKELTDSLLRQALNKLRWRGVTGRGRFRRRSFRGLLLSKRKD